MRTAKNAEPAVNTLKAISKTNIWDLSESDVVTLLENAAKDIEIETQLSKIVAVIKIAFEVEEVANKSDAAISALEKRGYIVNEIRINSDITLNWALKKKCINRVTDLTYENIHHITAPQLLKLIADNFGGGWDSLSLSIKDIILSGFHIATTSMPKSRVVTKSGLYGKKIADGFEVLELERGSWVDLIFVKVKEEAPKPKLVVQEEHKPFYDDDNERDDDDDNYQDDDEYANSDYDDDDDDNYDEEKLTEESYLTVTDEDPESLDIADVDDEEEDY